MKGVLNDLKKMKKVKFAICAEDTYYCTSLGEYLRYHLNEAFEIVYFTEVEAMEAYFRERVADLLLISDNCYRDLYGQDHYLWERYKHVIVLDDEMGFDEEGLIESKGHNPDFMRLSMYLPAVKIVDSILGFCADRAGEFSGVGIRPKNGGCNILGFYTPLHRCGQTTLALKMGELLAKDKKTILISFESFSALGKMFGEEPEHDLTDLIYYYELEPGCFYLNYERIKKTVNGLDIIPPAGTAQQIKEIHPDVLSDVLKALHERCGYENILLDLTEYPDGFFDILSACNKVYTITRNTPEDTYRVDRFREILLGNGYEDVVSSNIRCSLPHIRNKKEYDEYVRELIDESPEELRRGA